MSIQRITLALLISFLIMIKFSACTSSNQTGDKKIIIKASKFWMGLWNRNTYQSLGILDILRVRNDSIQFELHASSGGHESSVEGIAIASDTTIAIFSSKEGIDSCKIEFRFDGDSIIIRQLEINV